MCVVVCVCVCVRERERERVCGCVCGWVRERELPEAHPRVDASPCARLNKAKKQSGFRQEADPIEGNSTAAGGKFNSRKREIQLLDAASSARGSLQCVISRR